LVDVVDVVVVVGVVVPVLLVVETSAVACVCARAASVVEFADGRSF
jgi:hypothetical protein